MALLRKALALLLALAPQPARAIDTPHFVAEAVSAGIEHRYSGGWEFFVGGGVAAFDCDDDGFMDLYFAGGTSPGARYRNRSARGGPLRFELVADSPTALTIVTGAYALDIDGDGIKDLVLLRVGEHLSGEPVHSFGLRRRISHRLGER